MRRLSPSVYLSHSVSPSELGQVYALAQQLIARGVVAEIPHRAWTPESDVPHDLRTAIRNSELILLVATVNGRYLDWVNRELEAAGRNKPVIALVESGIDVHGVPQANQVIFDRYGNLLLAAEKVIQRIHSLEPSPQTNDAVGALALGALVLLFLAALGGKGKKE